MQKESTQNSNRVALQVVKYAPRARARAVSSRLYNHIVGNTIDILKIF